MHPIETEENPQQLFKELIKASHDGEVPKHLITRLKEVEAKHLQKNNLHDGRESNDLKSPAPNKAQSHTNQEKDNLYIAFQQLLLEEDDNN